MCPLLKRIAVKPTYLHRRMVLTFRLRLHSSDTAHDLRCRKEHEPGMKSQRYHYREQYQIYIVGISLHRHSSIRFPAS